MSDTKKQEAIPVFYLDHPKEGTVVLWPTLRKCEPYGDLGYWLIGNVSLIGPIEEILAIKELEVSPYFENEALPPRECPNKCRNHIVNFHCGYCFDGYQPHASGPVTLVKAGFMAEEVRKFNRATSREFTDWVIDSGGKGSTYLCHTIAVPTKTGALND